MTLRVLSEELSSIKIISKIYPFKYLHIRKINFSIFFSSFKTGSIIENLFVLNFCIIKFYFKKVYLRIQNIALKPSETPFFFLLYKIALNSLLALHKF
jgi:hypothetical protein